MHTEIQKPERFISLKNLPKKNDDGIVLYEEGKDLYGKADKAFYESDFDDENICFLGLLLMQIALEKKMGV